MRRHLRNLVKRFVSSSTSSHRPRRALSPRLLQCEALEQRQLLAITVEFLAATADVNEAAGTLGPMLLINGTLAAPAVVDVDITGGTATSGDYTHTGLVTIPAGTYDGTLATALPIGLSIVDDQRFEGTETVELELDDASADVTINPAHDTLTLNVLDNETATVDFQADADVTEGLGYNVEVTLSIQAIGSGTIGSDVPVSVRTQNMGGGTATVAADFVYGVHDFTFAAGDFASTTLVVGSGTTVDDRRLEGSETFYLDLGAWSSTTFTVIEGDTSLQMTILDNETATIDFQADASVAEGSGFGVEATLTIQAIGTGITGSNVSVTVTSGSAGTGTATAGTDYAYATQSYTFAPGDFTSAAQVIGSGTTDDDRRLEGSETFDLGLVIASDPTGAVTLGDDSLEMTILDNETATVAFQADANVNEGLGFNVEATLDIQAIGSGTIGSDVSVAVGSGSTGTGTATVGTDYDYALQAYTFAAGDFASTTQVVGSGTTADDRRLEGSETFGLQLGLAGVPVAAVSLGDTSLQIAILDNETAAIDIQPDANVAEGDGFDVQATMTIQAIGSGTIGSDVSVMVLSLLGAGVDTAALGLDYTYPAHWFTFAPGDFASTTQVIGSGATVDDRRLEGPETFDLGLMIVSDPTGAVSVVDNWLQMTILDNETAAIYFQVKTDVTEGLGFNADAAMHIQAIGSGITGSDVPVTVRSWNRVTGTASSGTDYAYATQNFTFAPADFTGIIFAVGSGTTIDDRRLEGPETFDLGLAIVSDPTGAVHVGNDSLQMTILDNETATINFQSNASVTEGLGFDARATMAIQAIGSGTVGSDVSVTVRSWDAVSGTATTATDYAYATQTFTFAPGDFETITQVVGSGTTVDDRRLEGSERFDLRLAIQSDPTGAVSVGDNSLRMTIVDNESAKLNFISEAGVVSTADAVAEGYESTFVRYQLVISATGTGTTGIDRALTMTADDLPNPAPDATPGTDYTADYLALSPYKLTFPVGNYAVSTRGKTTISILDDFRDEADENVGLHLAVSSFWTSYVTLSNYTLTITDDDSAAEVNYHIPARDAKAHELRQNGGSLELRRMDTPAGTLVATIDVPTTADVHIHGSQRKTKNETLTVASSAVENVNVVFEGHLGDDKLVLEGKAGSQDVLCITDQSSKAETAVWGKVKWKDHNDHTVQFRTVESLTANTLGGDDYVTFNMTAVKTTKVDVNATANGSFKVVGTSGNDTINVDDPGTVNRFRIAGVAILQLFGGDGNDTIRNLTNVRSLIDGGDGNDILRGGEATDLILGGGDWDLLYGKGGNDYLFADHEYAIVGGSPTIVVNDKDPSNNPVSNELMDGGDGYDAAAFFGTDNIPNVEKYAGSAKSLTPFQWLQATKLRYQQTVVDEAIAKCGDLLKEFPKCL